MTTQMTATDLFIKSLRELRDEYCKQCVNYRAEEMDECNDICLVPSFTEFMVNELSKVPVGKDLMGKMLESVGAEVITAESIKTIADHVDLPEDDISSLFSALTANDLGVEKIEVPAYHKAVDITFACGHTLREVHVYGKDELELERNRRKEAEGPCYECTHPTQGG